MRLDQNAQEELDTEQCGKSWPAFPTGSAQGVVLGAVGDMTLVRQVSHRQGYSTE